MFDMTVDDEEMLLKSLETPFGRFHALVGETELPIRHHVKSWDIGKLWNLSEYCGEVQFHKIDVDISSCSVGDIVHCRLEDAYLEFLWSDERVEFRGAVNDEFAIVVSGYNPEFDIYGDTSYAEELEKRYPYDLHYQSAEGFDYIIERDPHGYDSAAFYRSGFISLGAAWIPKPYESFTFDDDLGTELDFWIAPFL